MLFIEHKYTISKKDLSYNMLLLHGLYLLVALCMSEAVKVNMLGSLSLGRDVLSVLTEYVKENLEVKNGRRMNSKQSDLPDIIGHSALCKDIPFCRGTYEKNIKDYIVSLYKAIESVYEGTLTGEPFKLKPSKYLKSIKKILERANTRVTEENEVHQWTSVIKKISGVFVEKAIEYAKERVYTDEDKKEAASRVLIQKIVITISKVEMDYQVMFCTEHSICVKKMECSRSLNEVLGPLLDLEDYKLRTFVMALQNSIANTAMMYRLTDNVRKQFIKVLQEMSNSENSPIKDILSSVKKSVENRFAGKDPKGDDVVLLHMILGDMDHVYDMHKRPFEQFLNKFHDWIRTGDHLGSNLKQLVSDLSRQLKEQSSGLTYKMATEIQVFLELTIGSDVMV